MVDTIEQKVTKGGISSHSNIELERYAQIT